MSSSNQFNISTPRAFFKSLNTIFWAICTGLILVTGGFVFMRQRFESSIEDPYLEKVFLVLIAVVGIASLLGGQYIGKFFLRRIQSSSTLKEKLTYFMQGKIVEFALLEAFGILGGVGYFMTGNPLFLVGVGLATVYLLFLKPTPDAIAETLSLSTTEKKVLQDMDAQL